ncbi:MAG: hypothetical protein WC848_04090 [Parcubacteria group bacterium]|jgi:hypothetical protein
MDTKEVVKSKNFKLAASIIGIALIVLVSFAGGVAVGLHKARFSYQWGQNYERNFMGAGFRNVPDCDHGLIGGCGGMMDIPRNVEGRDFRNAHGLAGTIISISGSNLIVKDHDSKENTVTVTDKTIIKDRNSDIKITDLRANEQIVVMGAPNDQGAVNADLIRVFWDNLAPANIDSPASADNTNNN